MGAQKAEANAIGKELLAVLPNDGVPWYKKPYLLRLNFSILSLVLFGTDQHDAVGLTRRGLIVRCSIGKRLRWQLDERSPGSAAMERIYG